MTCDRCGSDRILEITGKVSDRGDYRYKDKEVDGYAPDVDNICGGDYIEPDICLECGKVQGEFPVADPEIEDDDDDDTVWVAPEGNGWYTK